MHIFWEKGVLDREKQVNPFANRQFWGEACYFFKKYMTVKRRRKEMTGFAFPIVKAT